MGDTLRTLLVASMGCAAVLVAPHAHAADTEGGAAAAAESLFQEGRKLVEAKRYNDACPKFAASQKLAPAIGTLLNLADCYERNNQLASAWARFHEAIALARRLGRANREQTARERADRLEPRLIRLTILSHSAGLDVKLDNNPIDPAVLGTPIPVDAGKHTLEATAKGKKPFLKEIEVSERSKTPSVDLPPLEDEPSPKDSKEDREPKEAREPKEGAKEAKLIEPPKEERGSWSTQKTVAVAVAGLGAASVGIGAFFGLKASSTWSDAQAHCTGLECNQEGVNLASDAKSSGNIATIAVIAGSGLLLGAAVLFFTAPGESKTFSSGGPGHGARWVSVGPGSVGLGGRF